jgi:hypothetical protein
LGVMIIFMAVVFGLNVCGRREPDVAAVSLENDHVAGGTSKVDFATQIKPILESRCMPCHFAGGKMYERLPFDRPETITKLATKLFTRIKDEHERRLIREFLSQQGSAG